MLAVIVGVLCFLWLLMVGTLHPPLWLAVSVFIMLAVSWMLLGWLDNKQFFDRIDRRTAEIDRAFEEDRLDEIL